MKDINAKKPSEDDDSRRSLCKTQTRKMKAKGKDEHDAIETRQKAEKEEEKEKEKERSEAIGAYATKNTTPTPRASISSTLPFQVPATVLSQARLASQTLADLHALTLWP